MNLTASTLVLGAALAALSACSGQAPEPATELIAAGPLTLSVEGEGELQSSRSVPLNVPGSNWASRQVVWMLPEGSAVKKGDVLARFSADEGKQDLAQALVDLQRNTLARANKEGELDAAQGRVAVDLSDVAVQLGIARRYANADLSTMARNDVLDAVQDVHYLDARQDTLAWQRDQAGQRGAAALAVLDAQRATYDINARTRQSDLDALELRAPNDGVLMLKASWAGDKPAIGSMLRAGFEFGSLPDAAAMDMELSLPQIEAQGVRVGAVVRMHPVGRPDQTMDSRLSWVAGSAKVRNSLSAAKYLSMKAPVPPEAARRYGLVPGQRMRAQVILLNETQALSVANVAIGSDGGGTVVQVRGGNGFEPRPVRLGVRGPARSQVLSGLKPGDRVRLTGMQADDDPAAADKNRAGDAKASAEPAGVTP